MKIVCLCLNLQNFDMKKSGIEISKWISYKNKAYYAFSELGKLSCISMMMIVIQINPLLFSVLVFFTHQEFMKPLYHFAKKITAINYSAMCSNKNFFEWKNPMIISILFSVLYILRYRGMYRYYKMFKLLRARNAHIKSS